MSCSVLNYDSRELVAVGNDFNLAKVLCVVECSHMRECADRTRLELPDMSVFRKVILTKRRRFRGECALRRWGSPCPDRTQVGRVHLAFHTLRERGR